MKSIIKVLLVSKEDSLIRDVDSWARSHTGYFLHVADVANAYEIFHEHQLDIVLIDLRGNLAGNLKTIRTLVADSPTTPITVIADNNSQEELIEALDAGASNYQRLPLSNEKLQSIMLKNIGLASRVKNRQFTPNRIASLHLELTLPSRSSVVPPAVDLLRSLLSGFLTHKELLRISLAFDEVLRNAYEHGNLGITSEEKILACNNSSFEILLREREKVALDAGKLIHLVFTISEQSFNVTVTDEGKGFNWRAAENKEPIVGESTNLQGRGVYLVKTVFDSVTYNESGNSITLVKQLAPI